MQVWIHSPLSIENIFVQVRSRRMRQFPRIPFSYFESSVSSRGISVYSSLR